MDSTGQSGVGTTLTESIAGQTWQIDTNPFSWPAASAPATRPDTTALQAGDRYYNTTTHAWYYYSSGWAVETPPGAAALAAANVFTGSNQFAIVGLTATTCKWSAATKPTIRPVAYNGSTTLTAGDEITLTTDGMDYRYNGTYWLSKEVITFNAPTYYSSYGSGNLGIFPVEVFQPAQRNLWVEDMCGSVYSTGTGTIVLQTISSAFATANITGAVLTMTNNSTLTVLKANVGILLDLTTNIKGLLMISTSGAAFTGSVIVTMRLALK